MKYISKILIYLIAAVIIFFLFRNCGTGCNTPTDVTTTDTTITEITGVVETETPPPTIEKPPIDSSIFKQLDKYKGLFRAQQIENEKAERYWAAVSKALQDSTLSLQSRYNYLSAAFELQIERHGIMVKYAQALENKLEETAQGEYLFPFKDSTDEYKLEGLIHSYAPLYENGFTRKVTVYQKTVTNTVTQTKYPNFSLAVLYGFTPDNLQIYSVQLGKDWKRVGVISQFGLTSDKDPIFSGGLKYNF